MPGYPVLSMRGCGGMLRTIAHAAAIALFAFAATTSGEAADAAFQQWLAAQWPAAQAMGVSRATFDAATRGLEPDLSLPDLAIPGQAEKAPQQPEFVQTPSQYLRETSFDRLAARGKQLAVQYRDTLARIEKEFFHNEFLHVLKMLQDGVPRSDLRSSWGGAMGLTQFLPSEYFKYAVDFDGDGRADIWRSVPDALASAAKQLAGKGWRRGEPWAIEVRAPANADCSIGVPEVTKPMGEWLKRGFVPAYGRKLSAAELWYDASLLQPEGSYGPSFLAPKYYFVLKDYNFSDLYVLFVGHLSDRISGGRQFETSWSKNVQLKTTDVELMQKRLTALGLYKDKIDGKAGMLTRAALGAYQKKNGLKVDCWPTAAVLEHMRR